MKREKLINIAKASGKTVVVFSLFLFELILVCLRFIFAGADTTAQNEASDNAAKGGVLNYRTGKFDNGTKATGWYDNH
jgi:hypothetical protein